MVGLVVNVVEWNCRMEYLFFKRPITHSTWIRTFAICLVNSTSFCDSCGLPFVKAGIVNLAP